MNNKHLYVRYKFSVTETDEDGLNRIKNVFPSAQETTKFIYLLFKGSKQAFMLILFPLWLISYFIDLPINKFMNWYERIVNHG